MEENSEVTGSKLGQFKKGDDPRRNLDGRPVGSLGFKAKWESFIDKVAKTNNLTAQDIDEQLLAVAYKKAKDGDYSFYRDTQDRVYGRPVQVTDNRTDITSAGQKLESVIYLPSKNGKTNLEA